MVLGLVLASAVVVAALPFPHHKLASDHLASSPSSPLPQKVASKFRCRSPPPPPQNLSPGPGAEGSRLSSGDRHVRVLLTDSGPAWAVVREPCAPALPRHSSFLRPHVTPVEAVSLSLALTCLVSHLRNSPARFGGAFLADPHIEERMTAMNHMGSLPQLGILCRAALTTSR